MTERKQHLPMQVLIVQRSKELPPKLRECLREYGYLSQTVFDIPSALGAVTEFSRPIVLVHCGTTPKVATEAAQQLVDSPELCDYPMIFIGGKIAELRESLERYLMFPKVLQAPITATTVINTILEIGDEYENYLRKLASVSPDHRLVKQQTPASTTDKKYPHPEFARNPEVTDVVFKYMEDLDLGNHRLHGDLLHSQVDEELLRRAECFPHDEETQKQVRVICDRLRSPERQHLLRTTLMSGRSNGGLKLSTQLAQQGISAALLMGCSFSERRSGQRLLRANYLKDNSGEMRREIAQRVVESASHVGESISEEIAEVLMKVAALITQRQPVGDDNVSILASSIVASDLASRVCFHSGYWDPYAANRLFHRMRLGELSDLHPKVVCCIIKFMAEALDAHRPAILVSPESRNDPQLVESATDNKRYVPSESERRVSLASLAPGMKLRRALKTYDGLELLAPGLTLDKDLIMRLWQLATLRPLNSPFVVEK